MVNKMWGRACMLLCACTWGSYAEGDNLLRLCSPGKNIEVCVDTDEGRLVYSVKKGKVEVLEASRLGLVVDGKDLGRNVSLAAEPEVEKFKTEYPLFGHHAMASDKAVEAMLPLSADGVRYGLVVRVYDDGVAVRYVLPENARRIERELTAWNVPRSVKKVAWAGYDIGYEKEAYVTRMDEKTNTYAARLRLNCQKGI